VGYALSIQGNAELGWGRLGRAAESLAGAAKLLEGESGHQYRRVVHYLGNVYMLQGRYQQAEAHLDQVIDHYAKLLPPFAILAFACAIAEIWLSPWAIWTRPDSTLPGPQRTLNEWG
jgi:hypothetical protein